LDEREDVFGYHRRDRSIFPRRIVPELSARVIRIMIIETCVDE
jgi:hypothetical protein